MLKGEFDAYLREFEAKIVVPGIESKELGQLLWVPRRPGRLEFSRFGNALGRKIYTLLPCAIDYYGFLKKSEGFLQKVTDSSVGGQIKGFEIPTVHFASLKIEKIARLAKDLVANFPSFKDHILQLRGFSRD